MFTYLKHRSVIEISGADRFRFLSGLLTCDVLSLEHAENKIMYGLFLTPQGKFLNDLFLIKKEDQFLIECEKDFQEAFLKRLKMYKLRADVSFQETSLSVGIFWNEEKQIEKAFQDPRLPELGQRIYQEKNALLSDAFDLYEEHRIKLGVPDGARDLPYEKAIPLEYGMDELGAISWDKGCYMGQELTARTRYRGLIRKRLLPIESAALLQTGDTIYSQDAEVGQVLSVSGRFALALVRLKHLKNACHTKEGQNVTFLVPRWMRLLTLEISENVQNV